MVKVYVYTVTVRVKPDGPSGDIIRKEIEYGLRSPDSREVGIVDVDAKLVDERAAREMLNEEGARS